jgi:hypothetical protein
MLQAQAIYARMAASRRAHSLDLMKRIEETDTRDLEVFEAAWQRREEALQWISSGWSSVLTGGWTSDQDGQDKESAWFAGAP